LWDADVKRFVMDGLKNVLGRFHRVAAESSWTNNGNGEKMMVKC